MTNTSSRSLLLAAYSARRLRLVLEIAQLDRRIARLRAGVADLAGGTLGGGEAPGIPNEALPWFPSKSVGPPA
jgi:hypothetical protein